MSYDVGYIRSALLAKFTVLFNLFGGSDATVNLNAGGSNGKDLPKLVLNKLVA